jgi:SET domain-containing protein
MNVSGGDGAGYIASIQSLTHPSNWPIIDIDGNSKVAQAVIFGLGSMFNHSTQEQNVGWMRDPQRQIITYRTLRDIPAGEELCE